MPALNLTKRPAFWRLSLALAFSLAGCAAPGTPPGIGPTAPATSAITVTPSPAPAVTLPPTSTPTAAADTATPAPQTAGACPAFAAGEPASGWNQLAGNPQRTGYSPEAPAEPWRVRWIWNGPGADGRPAPDHLALPKGIQPVAGDGRLYLGHEDGVVRALSAETGAVVWESPPLGNPVVDTAAYDPATASVFVGTADGRFWRLDAATGGVVRSNRPGGSVVMAPLLVGGTVFIGSTSGAFYAFDAVTLEQRWLYTAGAPLIASAAFAANEGGLVILLAEDGSVHAVCAADGARLWRAAVGGDADPLRGGARFPDTYPVVAEASGVALVRTYQAWDKMWQPGGGAPADPEGTRQFLEANPDYQSLFVLDLRDGSPRFTAPVLAGAIGNGGDFESTPPQAVVRAYPDGSEAAYVLWRSRQACVGGFCDGREDTTLGELNLANGAIRFVQDHKNAGSLRLPTDEQSPLAMAGDALWHAHWMLLGGVRLEDRSPELGGSYAEPIRTRELPPILNTLRPDRCAGAAGGRCAAVMQTPCDGFAVDPGFFVYQAEQCIYDQFWSTPVRGAVIHQSVVYWRTVDGALVALGADTGAP